MNTKNDDPDEKPLQPWLDAETEYALQAVIPGVMPERSVALYARWWQLETWLRQLTYVELRARYGVSWSDKVKAASGRRTRDAAFTHMSATDSDNPLAYLDYSQLIHVMGRHWEQFGYALLEQGSWDGRQEELERIRHRIGHMRKPHRDDLSRLEQTLRDLEHGAFIAYASYNRRTVPGPQEHPDPVADGWILRQHPTAQRLMRHAEQRYETTLQVLASRRPWIPWPSDLRRAPGVLWHADFVLRNRTIDVPALWHDSALERARPLLVHMLAHAPWHVTFTFAAADNPQDVSDAIGDVFGAVLTTSHQRDVDDGRWRRSARDLDYRVLTDSGWNIVDEMTLPISNFGAGGEVQSAPPW